MQRLAFIVAGILIISVVKAAEPRAGMKISIHPSFI